MKWCCFLQSRINPSTCSSQKRRLDLYVDPKLSLLNDHPKMFEINFLIPINYSSIIQPFYLINYSSLYDLSDGFSWFGQMKKIHQPPDFPEIFGDFPYTKPPFGGPGRVRSAGRNLISNDPFKALLRETNIVGLGQHGLDKTIRQCTCCVGWSHPIIGPPASWELLLMDKILHHLGWLKPYE